MYHLFVQITVCLIATTRWKMLLLTMTKDDDPPLDQSGRHVIRQPYTIPVAAIVLAPVALHFVPIDTVALCDAGEAIHVVGTLESHRSY